jgi:hypothetical protein
MAEAADNTERAQASSSLPQTITADAEHIPKDHDPVMSQEEVSAFCSAHPDLLPFFGLASVQELYVSTCHRSSALYCLRQRLLLKSVFSIPFQLQYCNCDLCAVLLNLGECEVARCIGFTIHTLPITFTNVTQITAVDSSDFVATFPRRHFAASNTIHNFAQSHHHAAAAIRGQSTAAVF